MKGNLQQCNNYLIINHACRIILKIVKNRLDPQAEQIITELQAGFRKNRNTILKHIFICEKHNIEQKKLYHIFIYFRKSFDRV